MEIEISGLTKIIKKNKVLDNINITLNGGHIYGLQGKNGCGKSMLMRAIAGLIMPTEGEIKINGQVLHKDISIPESIGVLIENPGFIGSYSGCENLRMLSMLQEKNEREDVEELMKLVGLGDAGKKKFSKYSLGMKQRLGIAAAIMGAPDIILLDEPINAIDEEGVEEIRKVITGLKDEGRIIIVACHDRDEMELLADKMITMKQGRITEVEYEAV